jgi:hypothetical protein
MIDDENISVIPNDRPIIHGPVRSGRYVPGKGRPKGSKNKRGRYVTISSIIETIQETLGCSFQEAIADMLFMERQKYIDGEDQFGNYPKILMQVANKIVEQARNMPEDTDSEISELTDEELLAKQKEAVVAYIKQYGIPSVDSVEETT